MVMGAVQRGGEVRLKLQGRPDRNTRKAYHDFMKENVHGEATNLYIDSAKAWGDLNDEDTVHRMVNHSKEEWVRADVHTNTVEGVWSLLKRSVVDTYHQLSTKHLPAYLDVSSETRCCDGRERDLALRRAGRRRGLRLLLFHFLHDFV